MGIVSNGSFWIYDVEELNNNDDWPTDYKIPGDYFYTISESLSTLEQDALTIPEEATDISVVAIGGGGYVNYTTDLEAAGGGAIAWRNNYPVTPGQKIAITIGGPNGSGYSSASYRYAPGNEQGYQANTYVEIYDPGQYANALNRIRIVEAGSGLRQEGGLPVIGTGYPGGRGGYKTSSGVQGSGTPGSSGGWGARGANGANRNFANLFNFDYTAAGPGGTHADIWGWTGNTEIQYNDIAETFPSAGYAKFTNINHPLQIFRARRIGVNYGNNGGGAVRIMVNNSNAGINRQFPLQTTCDWYPFVYSNLLILPSSVFTAVGLPAQ